MNYDELLAEIKKAHKPTPHAGLWLTLQQIEHIMRLARADAEAHEKAAVEKVMDDWRTIYDAQTQASRAAITKTREQAIRDCITAVRAEFAVSNEPPCVEEVVDALRALLENRDVRALLLWWQPGARLTGHDPVPRPICAE